MRGLSRGSMRHLGARSRSGRRRACRRGRSCRRPSLSSARDGGQLSGSAVIVRLVMISSRSKARRRQDSMPSASTSTLRMPTASRSSLSHSTILRSSIAVLTIGTISSSRSLGDDEAADMLRQMAGEAHDLVGPVDHMPRSPDRSGRGRRHSASFSPSSEVDQPQIEPDSALMHIVGQAHRLGHFAQRRAAAIGDDGGGQRGALLAVFVVDVLRSPRRASHARNRRRCRAARCAPRDEALEQRVDQVRVRHR